MTGSFRLRDRLDGECSLDRRGDLGRIQLDIERLRDNRRDFRLRLLAQDEADATRMGCFRCCQRLGHLEDWLWCLENRLGRLEDRLGCLEDRLGHLEEDRLGCLDDRLGRLEEHRLWRLEDRLGRLEEHRLWCLEHWLGRLEDWLECLEDRLREYCDRLSEHPGVLRLADGFNRHVDRRSGVVDELRGIERDDRRRELGDRFGLGQRDQRFGNRLDHRCRFDLMVGDRFVAIETASFERGVRLRSFGDRRRDMNGRLDVLSRRAFFGRGLQIRGDLLRELRGVAAVD